MSSHDIAHDYSRASGVTTGGANTSFLADEEHTRWVDEFDGGLVALGTSDSSVWVVRVCPQHEICRGVSAHRE